MAVQKKSLIGAPAATQKGTDGGTKPAAPPTPSPAQRLAAVRLATAKLSAAKLATLRKLS